MGEEGSVPTRSEVGAGKRLMRRMFPKGNMQHVYTQRRRIKFSRHDTLLIRCHPSSPMDSFLTNCGAKLSCRLSIVGMTILE